MARGSGQYHPRKQVSTTCVSGWVRPPKMTHPLTQVVLTC
jgi:hypothetical protein